MLSMHAILPDSNQAPPKSAVKFYGPIPHQPTLYELLYSLLFFMSMLRLQ